MRERERENEGDIERERENDRTRSGFLIPERLGLTRIARIAKIDFRNPIIATIGFRKSIGAI